MDNLITIKYIVAMRKWGSQTILQDGDVKFLNGDSVIIIDYTEFAEYLSVAAQTLEWLKFTSNDEW